MRDYTNIDRLFNSGKNLLDNQNYHQAIKVFEELLPLVNDYQSDEKVRLTYESSLNNIGVAKCQLAWQNKDLYFYEMGVNDIKKAIEVSGITDNDELNSLIIGQNLQVGINQMEALRVLNDGELKSSDPEN